MYRLYRTLIMVTILVLCIILPVIALAEDSNLVQNGDFESVDSDLPVGWMEDSWYADDESRTMEVVRDAAHGNYVHIINLVDNDVKLYQEITVKPDTYYLLTCKVRTKDIVGGAGANVSIVGSLATSSALLGTNDWQTVELSGRTDSDQETLSVAVRLGGYGMISSGEAWFDDFSVVELSAALPNATAFSIASINSNDGDDAAAGDLPYLGVMIFFVLLTVGGLCFAYKRAIEKDRIPAIEPSKNFSGDRKAIILLLVIAFAARCLLSFKIYGHPTDIYCFRAWALNMVSAGPAGFYTSGSFADYPPGYMYILWLIGAIGRALNLVSNTNVFGLMLKLPSILADMAAAYVAYRLARKTSSRAVALALLAAIAFNPAMLFLSAGWGQIDQILTLLLVLTLWLFTEKKVILAGVVYGIAILIKPQALMIGPLFALAYLLYIKDGNWKKRLPETILAVVAAFAVIILAAIPFTSTQKWDWLLEKYFSTATSYPYGSVEAFNLFALLGGNWKSVNHVPFLFSYKVWGMLFMGISILYSGFLYVRSYKRNPKGALMLSAAFLLAAIFTLGHYMHERYLFPVLLLTIIAFVFYKDKRLFLSFGAFSVSLLLNSMAAFMIAYHRNARGLAYDVLTIVGSLLTIFAFFYFAYVCTDILLRGRCVRAGDEPDEEGEAAQKALEDNIAPVEADVLPGPINNKLRYTKRDKLYCIALTAIYAVVALSNLGSLKAPQTYWTARRVDEKAQITLAVPTELSEIWVYGGLYEGTLQLTFDDASVAEYKQVNNDMYRWTSIDCKGITTQTIDLSLAQGSLWFNEIAIFDADGKLVSGATASGSGEAAHLLDEQNIIPDEPTHMDGMYFDELYHARTAYEHLHGIRPYENSHPPLGKVLIMAGVAVFGMNPFGWRVVGALFGVIMVPILYAFGKRLFKRSNYALLLAALFAFDFMHFTQTRIATIDVYGVFFILLMFYYMYQYYSMNFFADGLKKTLKPLAFAGLFFGLGAASKWIGIYAGAGLAVILFVSLWKRYREYQKVMDGDNDEEQALVRRFPSLVVKTLLWCCLFFIAVPIGIYLLSYIPYYLCSAHYTILGKTDSVMAVQEFMFSYHSRLTATHSFQSAWYAWPFELRPIWYFVKYFKSGLVSTISAMGNPAVWWTCAIGTGILIYRLIAEKIRLQKGIFISLVGVGANLLPWVLVTRCTFIYHYFATVPFILICTLYLLKDMEEKHPRFAWVKWGWLGLALLLFALFYPVISGAAVPVWYVKALEWLPGWMFLGY